MQVREDGLEIFESAGPAVALSRLYILLRNSTTPDAEPREGATMILHKAQDLYLTEVYLQGDGQDCRAIDAQRGRVRLQSAPPGHNAGPYVVRTDCAVTAAALQAHSRGRAHGRRSPRCERTSEFSRCVRTSEISPGHARAAPMQTALAHVLS